MTILAPLSSEIGPQLIQLPVLMLDRGWAPGARHIAYSPHGGMALQMPTAPLRQAPEQTDAGSSYEFDCHYGLDYDYVPSPIDMAVVGSAVDDWEPHALPADTAVAYPSFALDDLDESPITGHEALRLRATTMAGCFEHPHLPGWSCSRAWEHFL